MDEVQLKSFIAVPLARNKLRLILIHPGKSDQGGPRTISILVSHVSQGNPQPIFQYHF
jgi:hypothetical protein